MKHLLLNAILILYSISGMCQNKLSFDSTGRVKGTPVGFNNNVNSGAVANFRPSPEEKRRLKKDLVIKFEKAVDNLKDEKYNLKVTYDILWGAGETQKIINEYNKFLIYLNDTTTIIPAEAENYSYTTLIKPSDFERRIFNTSIYTEKETLTGKEYDMRQLLIANPYQRFLLAYLQETMSDNELDKVKMNIEYKQAWRDLEKIYSETIVAMAKIKDTLRPCVVPDCDTLFKDLKTRLKELTTNRNNYILQLLKKPFYKKWLWFNEGFLIMNPLGVTTNERQYPATEKISQLTESEKVLILSAEQEDKILDSILTTRKIKNEVLYPKPGNTNVDRYYYNGALGYSCINPTDLPNARDNRKGIAVIAYNVPGKEKLDFSFVLKESSGLGTVAQSIIDAGTTGSLSTIVSSAAGWTESFKKINEHLNVKGKVAFFDPINAPNIGIALQKKNFSTAKPKDQTISMIIMSEFTKANRNDFMQEKTLFQKEVLDEIDLDQTKELFVIINERKYAATKNSDLDKLVFINAYLLKADPKKCNTCFSLIEQCLIDTFIIRDRCNVLNYEAQKTLDNDVESLLKRVKCYTDKIDECRKEFKVLFKEFDEEYLPKLKAFISIIKRSLPPVLTIEKGKIYYNEEKISKDSAQFGTVIFQTNKSSLPAQPKDITYQVTSSLPINPADGKGSANIVIEHSFRYAKRTWIDFSAGLAYSVADYSIKSTEGGLPKISEGDKFRPIAGMHIYPFGGMLKVDDRLKPQLNRVSFFLGLGLTKALENFYPGLSYDIVPGIRVLVGYHLYKDTRYSILNNQVIDQASSYRGSGIFLSLSLEPKAFAILIGLIK